MAVRRPTAHPMHIAITVRRPLHGAVYRGLLPAIQLLVDEGASMEAVDVVGRTPLKLAEEGYFLQASHLPRDEAAALLAKGPRRNNSIELPVIAR